MQMAGESTPLGPYTGSIPANYDVVGTSNTPRPFAQAHTISQFPASQQYLQPIDQLFPLHRPKERYLWLHWLNFVN
jgi:hypothetical protein